MADSAELAVNGNRVAMIREKFMNMSKGANGDIETQLSELQNNSSGMNSSARNAVNNIDANVKFNAITDVNIFGELIKEQQNRGHATPMINAQLDCKNVNATPATDNENKPETTTVGPIGNDRQHVFNDSSSSDNELTLNDVIFNTMEDDDETYSSTTDLSVTLSFRKINSSIYRSMGGNEHYTSIISLIKKHIKEIVPLGDLRPSPEAFADGRPSFDQWMAEKRKLYSKRREKIRAVRSLLKHIIKERQRLSAIKYHEWLSSKMCANRLANVNKMNPEKLNFGSYQRTKLSPEQSQQCMREWERRKLAELRQQRKHKRLLELELEKMAAERKIQAQIAWKRWLANLPKRNRNVNGKKCVAANQKQTPAKNTKTSNAAKPLQSNISKNKRL